MVMMVGKRGMRERGGGGVSSKFRVEECNPELETLKPYFKTGGQNKPFFRPNQVYCAYPYP